MIGPESFSKAHRNLLLNNSRQGPNHCTLLNEFLGWNWNYEAAGAPECTESAGHLYRLRPARNIRVLLKQSMQSHAVKIGFDWGSGWVGENVNFKNKFANSRGNPVCALQRIRLRSHWTQEYRNLWKSKLKFRGVSSEACRVFKLLESRPVKGQPGIATNSHHWKARKQPNPARQACLKLHGPRNTQQ